MLAKLIIKIHSQLTVPSMEPLYGGQNALTDLLPFNMTSIKRIYRLNKNKYVFSVTKMKRKHCRKGY